MNSAAQNDASFGRTLEGPFQQTLDDVERGLTAQGFGILTRIDVKATLKAKLGVDFPRYEILGACRPSLAHLALSAEPRVGTFLPCNVVVQELSPTTTRVEVVNARAMVGLFPQAGLEEVAEEAQRRLNKMLAGL